MRDNRSLYEPLLSIQGGKCAICKKLPASKRRFDMDHNHKTMEIRGLLCVRCNRNLPDWMTPEWLEEAAGYLRLPPALQLIERESEDNV